MNKLPSPQTGLSFKSNLAEYRSLQLILLINSAIFIWSAMSSYDFLSAFQFTVAYCLIPVGFLILNLLQRNWVARIGRADQKWKLEFSISLFFSVLTLFLIYREILVERKFGSGAFFGILLVYFFGFDALFRIVKTKVDG